MQPEQTEVIFDNCSVAWDIELENGVLPSDSSSFAWETTVVIDAGRDWNDRAGMQQSLQPAMDSCDGSRSIATRGSDEHSPSSLRVASRFFSNRVHSLSLREGIPVSRMPAFQREHHPYGELEASGLDNSGDCHSDPDAGRALTSLSWETDPLLGDGCGADLSGTLGVSLR